MENNIREIKNIGQKYMADKLGVSQSVISDIESGKIKSISDERLNKIAEVLEVDAELIKHFTDSFIYNSSPNSGFQSTYHINPLEKIHSMYEQLLNEKEANINALKEIINLLKKTN
jgi:transcriptional regulator with XRE-family HTH domain